MKSREFVTSKGTKVVVGKSASNNDEIMEKFQGKNKIVMHTAAPGSPFAVIDVAPSKVLTKEKKEVAIFVAMKSQDWRDNKKNVRVDVFNAKDIYKDKKMKSGTWGVRKKGKPIVVKKLDIEKW